MTIAVAGATGQLGRLIVQDLLRRPVAKDVVALARSPQKGGDLGVPVREADYSRPETLGPALQGVTTLLLISSSEIGQRREQHRDVIAAAKAAGVRRFAFTSVLHADRSQLAMAEDYRIAEAQILDSGLTYTLLRNGWYGENYAGAVQAAVAHGALLGSARQGRISAALRTDFAKAAAVVLSTDGHDNKTYELAGDDSWTLAELAAEISRQVGKDIPYKDLPEAEYIEALKAGGLPEFFAQALAGADVSAADGALFDDSRTLSALTGEPTALLQGIVAAILKS